MARVLSLVGDSLVSVDAEQQPRPALALAWERDSSSRHWQFALRHGAKFHDGNSATASAIAQILGALHEDWNVRASGDSVIVDTEAPFPSLLAELALPRNLIVTRNGNGTPIGTGPFRT